MLLRALWRWSCFQLAERAGAAAEAAGSGLYEAALYGALSCHVARVLPVCSSWEDSCWAYLRCWLDASVDSALARQQQDAAGSEGEGDGLLAADALAAAAGGAGGALQDGLAVVHGGWPISRCAWGWWLQGRAALRLLAPTPGPQPCGKQGACHLATLKRALAGPAGSLPQPSHVSSIFTQLPPGKQGRCSSACTSLQGSRLAAAHV